MLSVQSCTSSDHLLKPKNGHCHLFTLPHTGALSFQRGSSTPSFRASSGQTITKDIGDSIFSSSGNSSTTRPHLETACFILLLQFYTAPSNRSPTDKLLNPTFYKRSSVVQPQSLSNPLMLGPLMSFTTCELGT